MCKDVVPSQKVVHCYKCGKSIKWNGVDFIIDDKLCNVETDINWLTDHNYDGADVRSCPCGAVLGTIMYYNRDIHESGGFIMLNASWMGVVDWTAPGNTTELQMDDVKIYNYSKMDKADKANNNF